MLAYDKEIYDKAINDIKNLCYDILQDCVDFADNNAYDREWVIDRFQEQFSKEKQRYLRGGN